MHAYSISPTKPYKQLIPCLFASNGGRFDFLKKKNWKGNRFCNCTDATTSTKHQLLIMLTNANNVKSRNIDGIGDVNWLERECRLWKYGSLFDKVIASSALSFSSISSSNQIKLNHSISVKRSKVAMENFDSAVRYTIFNWRVHRGGKTYVTANAYKFVFSCRVFCVCDCDMPRFYKEKTIFFADPRCSSLMY